MSDRNARRRQQAAIKRKLRNPAVRRLVETEMRRGRATEVYRFDGDDAEEPVFFNITEMREWAETHCEIFVLPVDIERAVRLVDSGAIDTNHIFDHTIRNDMKPIMVCRGLNGGDQIVDGAHTFVAICYGASRFGISAPVPAYVLEQSEWMRFVIPNSAAKICGMDR